MDRYHVESIHTPEECLRALDEIVAKGSDVLGKYEWGCMAGDHTGYAVIEAGSEAEVKKIVPSFLIGKTKIVKLNKFTVDQIRDFHKKSA
ncbi:MAG: hypothetical protein H6Q84_1057 [Deltaproteobacteria bacterium]|nr:hypothetical protein [Deltaproteobacteria bacterium]